MRATSYIIAEYNPFHNGHLYHIQKTREAGADTVVCVMSGNFTQRGEPAFCEKKLRAEMAIRGGADLVLENPIPCVISGAASFAKGAAAVIAACETPGTLSFGSLYPVKEILALRQVLQNKEVVLKAREISLSQGCAYPAAMREAVRLIAGEEIARVADDPNSILAAEYVSALEGTDAKVDLFSVERSEGIPHDAAEPRAAYVSAKYLRENLAVYGLDSPEMKSALRRFLPESTAQILESAFSQKSAPYDRRVFSAVCMTKLFAYDAESLKQVNGVGQGIENRILQAIRDHSDVYDLYDAVKTKRFTHARIRQIILSAVLDVKREDLSGDIPYVRVLGFNDRGRAFLRELKERAAVPVVMNISEAPESRARSLDVSAGKIYELLKPAPRNVNAEFLVKPFILHR